MQATIKMENKSTCNYNTFKENPRKYRAELIGNDQFKSPDINHMKKSSKFSSSCSLGSAPPYTSHSTSASLRQCVIKNSAANQIAMQIVPRKPPFPIPHNT